MSSVDTILFDWDGTLLDSAPYALLAFQKTFGELGIALALNVYERIYSPNWYEMYQALHPTSMILNTQIAWKGVPWQKL